MAVIWKIKIRLLAICIIVSSCTQLDTNGATPSPDSRVAPPTNLPSPAVELTEAQVVNPTMTFVPTLPAAAAEEESLRLLHTNGGCQLPCFWGFTPGQTSKETTTSFLHKFDAISPGLEINFLRGDLSVNLAIKVQGSSGKTQPEIVRLIEVYMTAYRKVDSGREEVYDSPDYVEYFQYYGLPSLLTTYGPPKSAYTFYEDEVDFRKYYLLLDYTKSGWAAMFTMPLIQKEGFFGGCPTESFITLWLWSPGDLETAKEHGFVNYNGPLKSIEESNSMSLEEFYQEYKDPTTTACLMTPIP